MPRYHEICIDTSIRIRCNDKKEAIMLINSLNADNIDIPEALGLDFNIDGEEFVFHSRYTGNSNKENNINTLINTIDEIMEHIALARDVIKSD